MLFFSFSRFLACAAALLWGLCSSALHAAPASPAVVGTATCVQWLQRLPGITAAQCRSAALRPSLGRSVQGRPLLVRDVLPASGAPATAVRVLVVGAMHGDELTSAALALQWIGLAEQARRPVHWRFLPILN